MPTTLNQYTLGRTLGSGVSCKVKLAKDNSNTRYAIKIIHSNEQFQELIDTECEALTNLQHPNIVRLIEVGRGIQRNTRKGEKEVNFIVLELVGGGELFDFVSLGGRLSEAQARYYYNQLLDGLSYMHAAGKCHRDLKPENLILDAAFNLKISDFGFAAPIEGRDAKGLLTTQLGTASYMAPEIHIAKPYEGARVDLFASAIILFVILTQRPPFASANPSDPHYRLLAAGRSEVFWEAHSQAEQGNDIYSAEFKDFFQKMMTLNPKQRPTIDEIRAHPWMQGPVPSYEEISADFTTRKQLVDQEAHRERAEKRERREGAAKTRQAERHRADGAAHEEGEEAERPELAWTELEVEDYGPYFQQDYTQFFTKGNQLELFLELVEYLQQKSVNYHIHDEKLMLKFQTELPASSQPAGEAAQEESKQEQAQPCSALVSIQVLQVNEAVKCVKFSYRDPQTKHDLPLATDIIKHYKEIRDADKIKNFNDATFEEGTVAQQ